jgi:hypothetical protein
MSGLEIFSHTKQGFMPLVDYGTWRVAILNDAPMYESGKVSYLDSHDETDEVFILLKGSCKLLTAGSGEIPDIIEGQWMKPDFVYNVKRGTWHSHILLPGTSVLVIENNNTSKVNTRKYELTQNCSI